MFGAPYRKRTALWTNTRLEDRLCNTACGSWVDGHHVSSAQRAPSCRHQGYRLESAAPRAAGTCAGVRGCL
jgi:hypothetical protein